MYVEYPLHTGLRYSETCRQRFVLKFVFNIQRLLFPQMRCGSGAVDVYTKVIKKHPAAVVLHAVNKQHRFMSYDGLFIQRKKEHYLRKLMRGLPLNKQRKRRAQKQLNPWLGPEATRRTRRGQEADRLQR